MQLPPSIGSNGECTADGLIRYNQLEEEEEEQEEQEEYRTSEYLYIEGCNWHG